jgi:hypothetical protein
MSARLRLPLVAVGAAAMVTMLGACTSSSGGGSASDGAARAAPAAVPSPQLNGGAQSKSSGGTSTRVDGRYTAVEIGTAKIRTAELVVQVKQGHSVAAQADAAEAIAAGAGGEVDADDRSSGRYAEATLVLRVPPEELVAALTQLSKLGIERSRHLSTQDVTSRVADVNSRVASAKGAIARLRVLYRRAAKISDIIDIEGELSQRESDLESLQAQQRALAAQTATASITLTLTSPPPVVKKKTVPPPKHHDSGFGAGLRDGWHAFTAGVKVLATVVGAVLPFAVLLVALALLARLTWSRLRPARGPAPAPPQ